MKKCLYSSMFWCEVPLAPLSREIVRKFILKRNPHAAGGQNIHFHFDFYFIVVCGNKNNRMTWWESKVPQRLQYFDGPWKLKGFIFILGFPGNESKDGKWEMKNENKNIFFTPQADTSCPNSPERSIFPGFLHSTGMLASGNFPRFQSKGSGSYRRAPGLVRQSKWRGV